MSEWQKPVCKRCGNRHINLWSCEKAKAEAARNPYVKRTVPDGYVLRQGTTNVFDRKPKNYRPPKYILRPGTINTWDLNPEHKEGKLNG